MNKTLLRIVTGQYEYVEITVDRILTPNEVKKLTHQYRDAGDKGVDEGLDEIIEAKGQQALNKLNTDRSDKIAKHKIDAVEDLDG